MTSGIELSDLTIVVPTRNEAHGIERFLASVPADVALIIVDSSDDATVQVVERTRPTTLVIRTMANIPVARQLGAAAAETEWIVFSDADVVFEHGYFAELESLSIDDTIGGLVGVKATDADFARYHRWFLRGQCLLGTLGIPAASGSNMIVRRAALDAVGGFDPLLSVNEDTELMFRIVKGGWKAPVAKTLRVISVDHRRLERSIFRKLVHGWVRSTALYLGWGTALVRSGDWGYWR